MSILLIIIPLLACRGSREELDPGGSRPGEQPQCSVLRPGALLPAGLGAACPPRCTDNGLWRHSPENGLIVPGKGCPQVSRASASTAPPNPCNETPKLKGSTYPRQRPWRRGVFKVPPTSSEFQCMFSCSESRREGQRQTLTLRYRYALRNDRDSF